MSFQFRPIHKRAISSINRTVISDKIAIISKLESPADLTLVSKEDNQTLYRNKEEESCDIN